jgi:predicted ATP-dependent protease
LDEDKFASLPEQERNAFHKNVQALEDYMGEMLIDLPQWRRTMFESINQLDNDTTQAALKPLLYELKQQYVEINDASKFLEDLNHNLIVSITQHFSPTRALEQSNLSKRIIFSELYLPNILVDYQPDEGAPVVYEPHPTYQNLFGRIEYSSEQGTLTTSYQKIRAGALHKANGGYLILDAEKLLIQPFAWDSLKRALQLNYIEIESPYADLGINTVTLKPKNIPLAVKIILLGTPDIYYFLEENDGEFGELFKVLADFENHIPLTRNTIHEFTALMQKHAEEFASKKLTDSAIKRLIEHSCRLAEHQYRFSARIKDSLDIIAEAEFFGRQVHHDAIDACHIESALTAREYRNGKLSQTILEDMLDGTILIDTDGEAIGKVNGLTIIEIGGSSFGAPARITATVYPGSRGIVDIEREAELGQSIHTKGVMILTGYLGHCYAQQFPLGISASIAIEQSYGYIDGDSASLAELCGIISALTRIPIRQYFAVTGSINQYGEVQAIGGVNEKIEGYFRLCHGRGLNGQHAVIIPAANVRNLVLKQEVIEAVKNEQFAVYAVAKVDEALELLTGLIAGIADKDGEYPEDSINFKAITRLKEISELSDDDDKEEPGT